MSDKLTTVGDLLSNDLIGKAIWDYKIYSPLSLEDNAEIEVLVQFGNKKAESSRSFGFKLVRIQE